jgi:hypothetical protein
LNCLFIDAVSIEITVMIGRLMDVEELVERQLAGKSEVLEGNPPQCHSLHHRSHMTRPGTKHRPIQ